MTTINEILGTELAIGNTTIDFDEMLHIHEESIDRDYAQQAAIFAYFATVQAQLEKALNDAKQLQDELYAECDLDIRADMDEREEKYTEAKVKSMVVLDVEYSKQRTRVAEAEHDVAVLKAITKALSMKADMLISLGANMRMEYGQTDMKMNQFDQVVDEVKQKARARRKQV